MRRLLLSGLMVLAFSVTAFAGVDVSKLQLPGDITQAQAIQYVWEKFIPAVLSDEARRLLPDVRHIVVAAAHRPRNPRSEAYREFCRRRIGEIAALPQVDFQAEEEYFRRCIEINS